MSFLEVFLKKTIESSNVASNKHSNVYAEDETQENNYCAEKGDVSIVPTRFLEVTLVKKRP